MNQTFNINRFGKLLKKDLCSIWPLYGVAMIIIMSCTMIPWVLRLAFGDVLFQTIHPVFRIMMIGLAVMLVSCLAPSRLYNNCNLPKEGIYFAMLPASKLEKFLCMILTSVFICPMIALGCGLVLDYLLYLIPFGGYDAPLFSVVSSFRSHLDEFDYRTLYYFYNASNPLLWITSFWTNVITFFFTTTIFKRHKFLYTILWLFLIQFVMSNLMGVLMIVFSIASDGGWLVEMANRLEESGDLNIIRWLNIGSIIFNLLYTFGLGWWSWVRLKKMKY